MQWIVRILAAACVMAAAMGNAQQVPRRIALVIGNGSYQVDAWRLANPTRDAALMAQRLRSLGFEVDAVNDASRATMEAAFDRFGTKLKGSGSSAVSFFYYAGHGAQVDGVNYLIPADANAPTMMRLRYQAMPMQLLLDDMIDAGNSVNIIVLDACRNLPLPEGARSLSGGGLADLGKPQNFFIAYATSPGRTASDGTGANSPFTTALAAALERQASDPIELLFSDVDAQVYRTTEGGQSPEYRNGLVRAPRWSFASAVQPRLSPASPSVQSAPSAPKVPGTVFRDCPECPPMVVISAGHFVIGSPPTEEHRAETENQFPVTIARPFAIGRFELTFAEWDACAAAGGCAPPEEKSYLPPDQGWGRANMPVINVNWADAKRYIRWLNERVGGNAYRLPTEAEWEYAARAGTTTPYAFGRTLSSQQANIEYEWRERNDSRGKTMPVGSFLPNAFGLYDTHGNVLEYVEDCFSAIYSGSVAVGGANVLGPCRNRVSRSGAFDYGYDLTRSASRFEAVSDYRGYRQGFRVARSID